MLRNLWPYLNTTVRDSVKQMLPEINESLRVAVRETIDEKLGKYAGPFRMVRLGLDVPTLDLGAYAPQIFGLRAMRYDQGVVTIEAHVTWSSQFRVRLEATVDLQLGLTQVTIPVELRNLTFNGRLYLTFGFTDTFPCISFIRCFVPDPAAVSNFDFELAVITPRDVSVTPVLGPVVKSVVRKAVLGPITYPKWFQTSLQRQFPSQPIGMLHVSQIRAQAVCSPLPGRLATMLRVSTWARPSDALTTTPIYNDRNPDWRERTSGADLYIPIFSEADVILFELLDGNKTVVGGRLRFAVDAMELQTSRVCERPGHTVTHRFNGTTSRAVALSMGSATRADQSLSVAGASACDQAAAASSSA